MADLQAGQAELAAQQQAIAQQAAAPQAAAPAANSLDDQLVQIQKLSVMKDQGLITEAEFTAKKAQILGL
jgi:membrane protease subunit (stomatin/prohibitin family)